LCLFEELAGVLNGTIVFAETVQRELLVTSVGTDNYTESASLSIYLLVARLSVSVLLLCIRLLEI
jgi:hypothetical protein